MKSFWHNTFSRTTVDAYTHLLSRGYDASYLTAQEAFIETRFEDKAYKIKLYYWDQNNKTNAFLRRINGDTSGMNKGNHIDFDLLYSAFPIHDKWVPFLEWMQNCAIIQRDFAPALRTLNEVLDFCGTVGQLVRAVPDLYQYLPKERKQVLAEQKRASGMPHAWASFDRTRIDNLQMSMAKASLFPVRRAGLRDPLWSEQDETWARYA
jgi:hypothetical protein